MHHNEEPLLHLITIALTLEFCVYHWRTFLSGLLWATSLFITIYYVPNVPKDLVKMQASNSVYNVHAVDLSYDMADESPTHPVSFT